MRHYEHVAVAHSLELWCIQLAGHSSDNPQEFGADLDAVSPKGWTPLSYCKAKGKYGATEEKGIYPEVSAFGSY
jgi:hypothetical protein